MKLVEKQIELDKQSTHNLQTQKQSEFCKLEANRETERVRQALELNLYIQTQNEFSQLEA